MKLYHATTVPDLEILQANSWDREGNPVLYLTDNFQYSLFYIRDLDINYVTCGVGTDGIVHYDEKFPNQLETLYRGMAGWVYEVDVAPEQKKTNGVYVKRGDARVIGKTYISDALQAIQTEIKKGTVDFLAFADTTEAQRALNQEGIVHLFLSERNMHPKKAAFLRTHFPEAWEEAQNILAQSK